MSSQRYRLEKFVPEQKPLPEVPDFRFAILGLLLAANLALILTLLLVSNG